MVNDHGHASWGASRNEGFSDAVFAFAITLLVLVAALSVFSPLDLRFDWHQ